MVNRFCLLAFVAYIAMYAGMCNADSIAGVYKGPGKSVVKIGSGDRSKEYELTYGDITQGYVNCDFESSDRLSVCLLFDFIDILIPKNPVAGEEYRYMGSVAKVKEHSSELEFGATHFRDIYRIMVKRSGTLEMHGNIQKRPGGNKTFELLYSEDVGLVGFRELPGNRESFFIVDWRSLEQRQAKQ